MSRGHQSFMVAAIGKSRSELTAILNDPERLKAAAEYHNVKMGDARFMIEDELRRGDKM